MEQLTELEKGKQTLYTSYTQHEYIYINLSGFYFISELVGEHNEKGNPKRKFDGSISIIGSVHMEASQAKGHVKGALVIIPLFGLAIMILPLVFQLCNFIYTFWKRSHVITLVQLRAVNGVKSDTKKLKCLYNLLWFYPFIFYIV